MAICGMWNRACQIDKDIEHAGVACALADGPATLATVLNANLIEGEIAELPPRAIQPGQHHSDVCAIDRSRERLEIMKGMNLHKLTA